MGVVKMDDMFKKLQEIEHRVIKIFLKKEVGNRVSKILDFDETENLRAIIVVFYKVSVGVLVQNLTRKGKGKLQKKGF